MTQGTSTTRHRLCGHFTTRLRRHVTQRMDDDTPQSERREALVTAKKGGDGIGYSGHKHQKGEKVLAIVENNGFVLAPLPVAPVNEADTVLLPDGLNALKRVARLTDLKIDGSYLNLDGGFDSRHNRKAIFNAGLVPNIKENPRNRKTPKRGRKRLFNAAVHSLRLCVERTFAWEDKFKRLLLRLSAHRNGPTFAHENEPTECAWLSEEEAVIS